MIVDEAAQVLREVSGSPVASEVGDCNAALMDAEGNCVVVGPLMISHALGCANVVKYILASYATNPEIRPGDMFISNDPYRGNTHQTCVVVVAPIFHAERLVAWTGAASTSPTWAGRYRARSRWERSRSSRSRRRCRPCDWSRAASCARISRRIPGARADARGECAGPARADRVNLALERRFREMVERFGIDTVTAVLARTIEYTAATVRERLREIPDGRWAAETFLDYDDRGDLSLYRCRLELTKVGAGALTLDFTDASPQAPAVVNCSRGGLEIAVLNAMLSLVGWDLPKCPAGVMQTYTVVSEPGRFIHASWPG